MANLDELLDIAYMGVLAQEWVTGHCPTSDFATWKAAICLGPCNYYGNTQGRRIKLPIDVYGQFQNSFHSDTGISKRMVGDFPR